MKGLTRQWGWALGITALMVFGGLLPLAESSVAAVEEQTMRQTLESHLTLAAHYRQEAKKIHAAIERHQLEIAIYQQGIIGSNTQGRREMVKRAERLVRYLREQYERMETLAQEHARMARGLEEGRRAEERPVTMLGERTTGEYEQIVLPSSVGGDHREDASEQDHGEH
ncbi:MAG: hypothetical protein HYZ72_09355 [Deltaproteobacteria bacterium]|nr:hypothetical protein [Deltaproteobacteria bacterium]